jgi:hypothetical protein
MRFVRPALALLLVAVFLSLSIPAEAQSKTLVWERYDTTLAIQPNGDLWVVERQQIRFTSGTFTFGFRDIPLDKTEGITQVGVSEPGVAEYSESSSQQPFTFKTSHQGDSLVIDWYYPPTANAVRTFDVSYLVHGALRIHDSGDKLQWFALATERDFGIQEASVTVILPPGASFQIIDSAGAQATWGQSADGTQVTFISTGSLSASESMEIGIEFTHGVVPDRSPSWQAAQDLEEDFELNVKPVVDLGLGLLGGVLALGGPAGIYYMWYTRGRDPKVGLVPEYIEEPPDDLPPGVLGTLLDEKADMRDVIATVIDLARKGAISIEETETKGFLGLGSSDFVFKRQPNGPADLNAVEAEVMKGIFRRGRDSIELSDLRNKFYTRLPKIQKKLYKEMVNRKFFRTNPDTTRKMWRGIGFALIFGAVFIGGFASSFLSSFTSMLPCVFGAIGLIGLALVVAGGAMPAKTDKGSEAAARWNAFKQYLTRIEQLADLEKVGELFEKYLPYAIAFGIRDSWINKFARVPSTPIPVWYYPYMGGPRVSGSGSGKGGGLARPVSPGSGGLQGMSDGFAGGLQSMSDGLTRMLNSTGRVMQSAPSSSGRSGGGFSSGGFSGGGGGGGGGGGFG